FPLVAINGSRVNSQSFELVIEQNPRSRPRLPIDKPAILTGEIVQTVNRFRFAAPHQDTLFSLRQMNQDDRRFSNVFCDVGYVVDAGFRVKEMSTGDMSLAALQSQQSSQAPNIGCSDLQSGVS